MTKMAVFGSGSGTNFEAIVAAIQNGQLAAEVVLVGCDKPQAKIVEKAKRLGIDTIAFDPKSYPSKAAYEQMLVEEMRARGVEWVVLAGFMRLVGETLLHAYAGRIINIHPSLLPAYKGKEAIERAYAAGETTVGVTIHYVDEGMDTGQMIAQEAIVLQGDETLAEIEARIHRVEHRLYPETLQALLQATSN